MRALILNGAQNNDITAETVSKLCTDQLKRLNYPVNLINLCSIEISSCLGCFGCWVKTPGICVIDDVGRDIAKSVVQSDLVITITPITFGGYSYELKKALDRLIPILSPFFMKIAGEIHHKPRYKRYPCYINLGILSEMNNEMADTFTKLATRNAINMQGPASSSGIVLRSQTSEEINEKVSELLKTVGVSA